MLAVDTNVIVRYLTGDDRQQAERAAAVIESGEIFVSRTVLLECDWVLRSVFGFTGKEAAEALRAFMGLPGVTFESPKQCAEALARTLAGMDFADALHLGAAAHCETMFTFDQGFIKATRGVPVRVTEP